jgi:sulfite exporter TauE/SafE
MILGIILLLIGAAVAYFGRPREQLIVWAGVIIFLIGVVLIVLALLPADADASAFRSSWG